MRKRGNIVRYSAEGLAAMEARGEDRTDWAAIASKTEEELAADMAGDPVWDGVPADWVSRARAATGLMRRPAENKRQVTMRFDADVLEFFKRGGRGWQGQHECRAAQLHGAPGASSLSRRLAAQAPA
jgi:uncharacterized protein (DUF4415 family)